MDIIEDMRDKGLIVGEIEGKMQGLQFLQPQPISE